MSDEEDFFDAIYELENLDETAAHYAKFAEAYDEAMAENGYLTPKRCADALIGAGADPTFPVLDLGCGSGLSGMALKAVGFETLDGTDFSTEMLERAAEKGIYRDLWQGDLSVPDPSREGSYHAINAAGVINPAHAPPVSIDNAIAMLKPGGLFAFSLNDHAIAAREFEGRVHMMLDAGWTELLHREYGEHMPGKDLRAWVYVLRKR